LPVPLLQYHIPQYIRDKVNDGKDLDSDDPFPMDEDSHLKSFDELLYIEEIQMEKDIRKYDLTNVCLVQTHVRSSLILKGSF
jgi:hypothetical protein